MSAHFPHIDLVPKELDKNKAWRKKLYTKALKNVDIQKREWKKCREDMLYYINAYCKTFDPRKEPSSLPFITYEFQDRAFEVLLDTVPNDDLLIEKSRDMGASWMILTMFEWFWHFHGGKTFLLVSRKEDLVDKLGDPKSLYWKIDYLHQHQPSWMLPKMRRKKLHLGNLDNGSTIDGESTTGDVARGDRRTAIMLDEFAMVDEGTKVLASTTRATNCRIFNSTPQGTGNAFYDVSHSGKVRKLRFHWSDHPERNAGAYRDRFGKWTSPWYMVECSKKTNQVEIAQELDIDYMGSGSPFFDAQLIDDLLRIVRAPYSTGEIHYDEEEEFKGKWQAVQGGRFKMWLDLDKDGLPPANMEYVIGADIATGKAGAQGSNSVLSVVDRMTGVKVGEMATPSMFPAQFSHYAIATCKFFNEAMLIWEANGPGGEFGVELLDKGYRNLFMRRKNNKQGMPSRKYQTAPGWWSSKDSKRMLIGDYAINLRNQRFKNFSIQAVQELQFYEHTAGGKVEHARSRAGPDLSGAGENHGDRVIADALANLALRSYPQFSPEASKREFVDGSFGYRRENRKKSQSERQFSLEAY